MIVEELILGLFVAAGLSAAIGLEREIHGQPAGLRTHIILGIGAALASMVSILFSQDWSSAGFGSDPARIVAQVVSGVGFLGAGAILRHGVNIKGLTTASSLWTTAIVGIASGAGYYLIAAITTTIVLLALTLVNRLGGLFLTNYHVLEFKVVLNDRPGIIDDFRRLVEKEGVKVVSMVPSISDKDVIKLALVIRVSDDMKIDTLIRIVKTLDETRSVEF